MKITKEEAGAFRARDSRLRTLQRLMEHEGDEEKDLWNRMRNKYKLKDNGRYSVDWKKRTLNEVGLGGD